MTPLASLLLDAIGQSLRGKEEAIELALIALFAGGHVLIEDQPGVGTTLLAKSLAKALDLPFQRIQCTADLLPTDIVGAQVYQPKTGELTFRQGPVFTSVLPRASVLPTVLASVVSVLAMVLVVLVLSSVASTVVASMLVMGIALLSA